MKSEVRRASVEDVEEWNMCVAQWMVPLDCAYVEEIKRRHPKLITHIRGIMLDTAILLYSMVNCWLSFIHEYPVAQSQKLQATKAVRHTIAA